MAPDALVVLDDLMAMGVVLTARELGLHIPEDLGLVSFNDTHLCNVLERGLTSISLNIEAIVREAVGCLMAQIRGEVQAEPKRILVPCQLRRRGSSAPVRRGEEALR
jgi:LacI family transcriptional regulator